MNPISTWLVELSFGANPPNSPLLAATGKPVELLAPPKNLEVLQGLALGLADFLLEFPFFYQILFSLDSRGSQSLGEMFSGVTDLRYTS